jgi:hypothetical protein
MAAAGSLLTISRMEAEGLAPVGDSSSPVLAWARQVADYRLGEEWTLMLVNVMDELLDMGRLAQYPGQAPWPEPGTRPPLPCGRLAEYHLRKHALFLDQPACPVCRTQLTLSHGHVWPYETENAVIHRDDLVCSACVADELEDALAEVQPAESDGMGQF